MRAPLLLVLLVAVPAIAHAGGGQARGKRKPRPAPIDVAGAVASGQADRLCAAALDLVAAGQHPRASFLIAHCAEVPARAEAARAARIAIARRATAEAWSQVEIGFRGDAVGAPATVRIDAFPDTPVAVGTWKLPAGRYAVSARVGDGELRAELTLEAHSRALVLLEMPVAPPAAPARAGVIDFGRDEGGPIAPPIVGPPPKAKHESLLPARFRAGLRGR
jgi:hypothetical protein